MKINSITLVFMSALLWLTGCYKDPQASFTVSASSVEVDETVSFTNTSTDMDRCEWLFGDGDQSTETNASHAYSDPGVYEVTLRVFSKKDMKADKTTNMITVIQPTYLVINVFDYSSGDAIESAVVDLYASESDFNEAANSLAEANTNSAGQVSFKNVPDGTLYISIYKYAYNQDGYDYFYCNWFTNLNGNTYNTSVEANKINEVDIYARLAYYPSSGRARNNPEAEIMNTPVQ